MEKKMAQIPWTKEQKRVINTSGKDILVAAGAGSGKTAVLVERIIKKVTDPDHPVDIDRFLIVTFTKAAAAQMREKIREKLYELSYKNPTDENLKRQLSLVHTANISTIDSFAKKVVSTNFEKLDIDPSFRLMEQEESDLLLEDCIDETVDEMYVEGNQDFLDAMSQLAKGDVSTDVVNKVSIIVKKAKNQEYPAKWLADAIDRNYSETEEDFNQKEFVKRTIDDFEKYKDFSDDLWTALNDVEENETPTQLTVEVIDQIKSILPNLEAASTYSEYRDAILSYGEIKRSKQSFDDFKEQHNKLLAYIQSFVGDNKKSKYFPSLEEAMADVNKSQKTANVLLEIAIKSFEKCMKEKKRICAYDFSDVAHFAIEVLCVPGENGPTASDTAKKMAEGFEEILIDEYQDSNYIQEYMLFALSKGQGINNVFMVGDIKQSIYRFRSAEPKIFLEKLNDFEEENDEHTRIILDRNFRSRPEVIEFTNLIFNEIMNKDVGGINYKDGQKLVQGAKNYNESLNGGEQDNKSELICVPSQDGISRHEVEANIIAKKILNMMNEKTGLKITDEKAKKRSLRYNDIVILTRYPKNVVDTYLRVLEEYGIPVYGEKRDGFYESSEIKCILDFLSVIDNPMQDIPLAGVMTSAFYQFDESELGYIRLVQKDGTFYEAVNKYAEDGTDQELKDKVKSFLDSLKDYREKVKYMSVYEFINYFLDSSHFDLYVRSLPAGTKRILNVDMLKEIAYKYENSSYRSLFNFVRYVNKSIDNNKEIGEASNVHEDDNVVRITSIHQSKGLEYPVVILSNVAPGARGGNKESNYLVNSDGDIGLDVLDTENKTKTDTLLERYIVKTEDEQDKAEELRLLYVAMTRAKEKLVITAIKLAKKIEKKDFKPINNANKKDAILKTSDFYQMIAPVLGTEIYDEVPELIDHESNPEKINKKYYRVEMYPTIESYPFVGLAEDESMDDLKLKSDEEITNKIIENFDYKYDYKKEAKLRAKMSVTEIKRRLNGEFVDEDAEYFIPNRSTKGKPNFVEQEDVGLTGADLGNAYHKVFELLDYSKDITDKSVVKDFLDDLVSNNKLTEEERGSIEEEKVTQFAKSSIGQRMKAAFDRNELYRERKFLLQVDGKFIEEVQGIETDETMIVQGIIDACFVEDGKYVIVDYKTDNVDSADKLVDEYKGQLNVYEKAVKEITGKDVSDKIIYSVTLGKEKEV
ncbi:MAG: helicase-exonuclease AddAB subunit AddA [Eubacterium sp.]|nr:helicase-exonuclease AddAB subunit AddA [Eubacterium sp.]